MGYFLQKTVLNSVPDLLFYCCDLLAFIAIGKNHKIHGKALVRARIDISQHSLWNGNSTHKFFQ